MPDVNLNQETIMAVNSVSLGVGPTVTSPPDGPQDEVADDEGPLESSGPPSKRARTGASRITSAGFQRKRALAACRLCRTRKVKCNNSRPACGSCVVSDSLCVYDDAQDLSTFDPASITILDRLSQVLTRLDQLPEAVFSFEQAMNTGRTELHHNYNVPGETISELPTQPLVQPLAQPQSQSRPQGAFDDLRIPAQPASPDAVLVWPMLESRFPPNYLINGVFEAELVHDGLEQHEGSIFPPVSGFEPPYRGMTYGVNEDEVPSLVRQFLALVHSKNPILDVDLLWMYVDRLVETGPAWDPASCLVLLVCALGCVAQPFIVDESSTPSGPGPRMPTSRDADAESLRKASGYYKLARRRFGLLEGGILAPQCHFLAGVYSMYIMSPLKAWSQFHSASRSCHIYLLCEAHRNGETGTPAAFKRTSMEQRIFWSCYKSECELRIEMNLPNSSLADLEYPVLYPKPPETLAPHSLLDDSSPSGDSTNSYGARRTYEHEEQTWYYYLTDITLRRMGNRICSTLYADGHASWNDKNMPFMLKAAEEFENKFDEWYSALPSLISFTHDETPSGELRYLVQSREVESKMWLYRPFLYYAIHHPADAFHRDAAQHLIDKAIYFHLRFLKTGTTRHRTHGTWYGLRGSTGAILALIAAARCGTIVMPPGWKDAISSCIERMRYWEDEVPAVARSIQILEEYM